MKKILVLIIFLLSISVVSADMNISISPYSKDGNIDIHANPSTGGNTTYYLDGTNFKDVEKRVEMQENRKDRDGINSISKAFYNFAFGKVRPVKFEDVRSRDEQRLRWVLENYFVPRFELMNIINDQKNEINEMKLQLLIYEKMFTEEELCNSRKEVAKDLGIEKIECNGRVYKYSPYNDDFYTTIITEE